MLTDFVIIFTAIQYPSKPEFGVERNGTDSPANMIINNVPKNRIFVS